MKKAFAALTSRVPWTGRLLKVYSAVMVGKHFYDANPFGQAFRRARLTGNYLGLMLDKMDLLDGRCPSFVSYSLGSLVSFDCLTTLFDLGSEVRVGDVCLLGSVIDREEFYSNVHKLVGSKGIVQGRLTVAFSSNDMILSYLFRIARIGHNPIGISRLDPQKLVNGLKQNDPAFAKLQEAEIRAYIGRKIINMDVSHEVQGHSKYLGNLESILVRSHFCGTAPE